MMNPPPPIPPNQPTYSPHQVGIELVSNCPLQARKLTCFTAINWPVLLFIPRYTLPNAPDPINSPLVQFRFSPSSNSPSCPPSIGTIEEVGDGGLGCCCSCCWGGCCCCCCWWWVGTCSALCGWAGAAGLGGGLGTGGREGIPWPLDCRFPENGPPLN